MQAVRYMLNFVGIERGGEINVCREPTTCYVRPLTAEAYRRQPFLLVRPIDQEARSMPSRIARPNMWIDKPPVSFCSSVLVGKSLPLPHSSSLVTGKFAKISRQTYHNNPMSSHSLSSHFAVIRKLTDNIPIDVVGFLSSLLSSGVAQERRKTSLTMLSPTWYRSAYGDPMRLLCGFIHVCAGGTCQ